MEGLKVEGVRDFCIGNRCSPPTQYNVYPFHIPLLFGT